MSDTVIRLTRFSEREMPPAEAMIAMTREIMAAQAQGDMPRVKLSEDGRITLRWPDDEWVSYQTGQNTMPYQARKA